MPTVLQLRRGTTAEHSSFTGAEGEVTVNTTKDTLVVHDGSTQGGFEVALADGTNFGADTDDISEGSTNLYYTDARVESYLSGGTGVTYSSGTISIGQAVGTGDSVTFAGVTAPLTGNVTGDVTGDVTGNVTGNIDGIVGGTTPAAGTFTTLTTSSNGTVGGNLTVTGDFTVNGTTTTINSTTMTVDDLNMVLASGAADSAAADGAGITVDGANASLIYDHTGTQWEFNKNLEVTGHILPNADVTYDLGSSSLQWRDLYLEELVLTGDATFSNDSSVTAAGSDQSGATALSKTYSVVGTATADQGVKLPTAVAGLQYTVKNDTAVNIKIYPNTSGTINGGGANAAIDCPAGSTTRLIGASSTDWDTLVDMVVYDSSGTRLN